MVKNKDYDEMFLMFMVVFSSFSVFLRFGFQGYRGIFLCGCDKNRILYRFYREQVENKDRDDKNAEIPVGR